MLYQNSLRVVYTRIMSYSLLSQCGINWIYYLYEEYICVCTPRKGYYLQYIVFI